MCFGILIFELLGAGETIDEEGLPTAAVGMGKQVEGLESGWISEIGIIGMGREGEGGISRVFHSEIGGEVIEAAYGVLASGDMPTIRERLAIVCDANEGYAL
jgi:hypothetical protein